MKNVLVALNVVLLAAVGFLFYKYFTLSKGADSSNKITVTKEAQAPATVIAASRILKWIRWIIIAKW